MLDIGWRDGKMTTAIAASVPKGSVTISIVSPGDDSVCTGAFPHSIYKNLTIARQMPAVLIFF